MRIGFFAVEKTKSVFLKEILKEARVAFIYVFIFSCFVNVLMLTVSIYMLQIFDRVFASHSYDTLLYLTIIALFALVILSVLDYLRTRILFFVSHWLEDKASPEALHRSIDSLLQGQAYAPQSLKDIGIIRNFLSSPAILSLLDTPWVPIYLLVIFLLHPVLGFISLFGGMILFVLAVINDQATRSLTFQMNNEVLKAQNHLASTLRNAESIQAMGMLPSITERWFNQNQVVLKLQDMIGRKSGIIVSISKFLRLAIQIFILGVGAYLVINNEISSGAMIAASIILSRALAPIEQSISVWGQFMNVRQAYQRLDNYLAMPTLRSGEISLPKPEGRVTVEEMSFAPPGTTSYILRGINFLLQPGETLAIIGPSAAGKTTLVRLLVGAWPPTLGNVRLDDADVYAWRREDLGPYVGYLPQSIELFTGTIKENIARMNKSAKDDDIIQAAMDSNTHNMILRLAKGYDTNINEMGQNLSAGQKQRIGLARALYLRPPLIVLDEPNSNLDSEGEIALVNAIISAKKRGETVIFVAHRPGLVMLADKVLYLVEGRQIAFGPTQEILAKLKATQEMADKTMADKANPTKG